MYVLINISLSLIYIYIYIEREREKSRETGANMGPQRRLGPGEAATPAELPLRRGPRLCTNRIQYTMI